MDEKEYTEADYDNMLAKELIRLEDALTRDLDIYETRSETPTCAQFYTGTKYLLSDGVSKVYWDASKDRIKLSTDSNPIVKLTWVQSTWRYLEVQYIMRRWLGYTG